MTTTTTAAAPATLASRITADMVAKMSTAELRLAIKTLAGVETATRNTTGMRKRVLALIAKAASSPAAVAEAKTRIAAATGEPTIDDGIAAERKPRAPKGNGKAAPEAKAPAAPSTAAASRKAPEAFAHDHRVLALYRVGDRIEKRGRDGKLVASVEVVKDGFAWHGKTYESLSAIAQEVTGTEQSGLVYFGVIPYNDRGRKGKTTADLAPAFKRAAEIVNAAEGPDALILPSSLTMLEAMPDHAQAREYLRIIRQAQAELREAQASLALAQNLLEVRHGRVLLDGEVA